MKKITQDEIDELRAKTPHADLDDLRVEFTGKANLSERNEDLLAYLKRFAKPSDRACLCCGAHMSSFTWGLVHGHGHCIGCGWPATLYHFIKDRHGKDLATVRGVLLQAHPDEVSVQPK